MAKRFNPRRIHEIVEAAREAFIANHGYKRTQMADVARALGLASGTLYLYVESKAALYDTVVRGTNEPAWLDRIDEFPIAARPLDDLLEYLRRWFEENPSFSPTLEAALASNECKGGDEFVRGCGELYDATFDKRYVIKLVEACAGDFPEILAYWFNATRVGSLDVLTRYLSLGSEQGNLRGISSPLIGARQIVETIAFWALHRHWDPAPLDYDESLIRESAVRYCVAPFVSDEFWGKGDES